MRNRKTGIDNINYLPLIKLFLISIAYSSHKEQKKFVTEKIPSSSKVFIFQRITRLSTAQTMIFWKHFLSFFFFPPKHSIRNQQVCSTIHSLFSHTHTSTNISFLKCETGLPGGVFTFYVTVDEATTDTGNVIVKS